MPQTGFGYLMPEDWKLLANRSVRLKFRLGQEIIHAGNFVHHLYIIRTGSASVELPTAYATTTLAVLSEGDICGEGAFAGDGTSTATVVARDIEVEVEAIDVGYVNQLCRDIPGFGFRLFRYLAARLAYGLKSTSAELIRALNARSSQE
jgi:CRP-like cAMP-binding protein